MGDGLVYVEVTGAHPDLGQQPVVFCIGREKDGVVFSRGLVELVLLEEENTLLWAPPPQALGRPFSTVEDTDMKGCSFGCSNSF